MNPTGLFGSGGAGIQDLDELLVKLTFFWTTIFAVKFGFLSFFRVLVIRLPGIHLYWRVVVAVNVIVYLFSLIDGVIACPHDGLTACMSNSMSFIQEPRLTISIVSCSVDYARKIGAIAIGLDILTDLMSKYLVQFS